MRAPPKTLLISHPDLLRHGSYLSSHPESPQRLETIFSAFTSSPMQLELSLFRLATQEELLRAHSEDYIQKVMALDGKTGQLDHETYVTESSVQAALLAAGLGLELIEQILKGKVQNGFAIVRPPGHHATSSQGMGFCIFNHIAIGALHALSLGVKKILILDWDVHHGNGTQEIFYEDDRVLFMDLHQDGLFPLDSGEPSEIGKGVGEGFTVNIPILPCSSDPDYLDVFEHVLKARIVAFQPELILISAGFDAHANDPLGGMHLTSDGFALLTQKINELAEEICHGRIAFFLEGGYNPHDLANNVLQCCNKLVKNFCSQASLIGPIGKNFGDGLSKEKK